MKQRIARLLHKAAHKLDPPKDLNSLVYNISSAAGVASAKQIAAEMRVAQAQRNLDRARRAAL